MPNIERLKRKLSILEEQVVNCLYEMKAARKPVTGFVTTTEPLPMGDTDGKGPWGPNPARIIPVGSTLKIVMVSRMGDAGLTDNLNAEHGYHIRLDWEDAAMTDIRLTKDSNAQH